VIALTVLARPEEALTMLTGTTSRKMPTKKPTVTTRQAKRMGRDGSEWRMASEVNTVNGNTRPQAIW
jgi:hypothetical protein